MMRATSHAKASEFGIYARNIIAEYALQRAAIDVIRDRKIRHELWELLELDRAHFFDETDDALRRGVLEYTKKCGDCYEAREALVDVKTEYEKIRATTYQMQADLSIPEEDLEYIAGFEVGNRLPLNVWAVDRVLKVLDDLSKSGERGIQNTKKYLTITQLMNRATQMYREMRYALGDNDSSIISALDLVLTQDEDIRESFMQTFPGEDFRIAVTVTEFLRLNYEAIKRNSREELDEKSIAMAEFSFRTASDPEKIN